MRRGVGVRARTVALALAGLVGGLLTAVATPAPAQATPAPGAPAVVAVSRVGDQVLDPTARGNLSYGTTANVASYQQHAIVSDGRFQYTAWYAADRTAVLARRSLAGSGGVGGESGAWDAIRLDAVLYSDDSHNNITLGISPSDGRLHVALATHTTRIRYLRSLPGLTGGAVPWSSQSFEAVRADLPGAPQAPQWWTYPAFENVGDDFLLTWRDGSAMGGGQVLARYDGKAAGTWTYLGRFSGPEGTWTGPFGSSTSRYGYLHGFAQNPVTGDLEITWTWRENASAQDPRCSAAPANRDLAYARSPDRGMTWYNQAGVVVGRTGTSDVITTADDTTVVPIGVETGMINQETQAVDSTGAIHVVTSQLDADALAAVGGCLGGDYYVQRAEHAEPVHHWRDADGVWHSVQVPFAMGRGGRSSLVLDADDTAVLALPDGRVVAASAASGWTDWQLVFDGADTDSGSEVVLDRDRVLRDGVLSIGYQEAGVPVHAPSAFRVADFRLASAQPHTLRDPAPAAPARPYEGSAPSLPTVSASSAQPNHPAQFAADGRADSYWLSGRPATSVQDGVEWVTDADAVAAVDGGASAGRPQELALVWGEARWVDQVRVVGGGARGPRDFVIQTLGTNGWITVGQVRGQAATATHPVKRAWARGVRLLVTAGNSASAVQVSELSTTGAAPSTAVTFGAVARRRDGSARLSVGVDGPGSVALLQTPRVARSSALVPLRTDDVSAGAATVQLRVQARGPAARRISLARCKRTRAKRVTVDVPVRVRYAALGGSERTVTSTVRLVRRCG
ncbi:MAG: BNR-4 repeat-containing protein [Nocardioides sp.]|uniref:BNR-4 repeat-containing protein n=1 Tax=Nocardioides sp. TaxID=35761 RepID=UPI003F037A79